MGKKVCPILRVGAQIITGAVSLFFSVADIVGIIPGGPEKIAIWIVVFIILVAWREGERLLREKPRIRIKRVEVGQWPIGVPSINASMRGDEQLLSAATTTPIGEMTPIKGSDDDNQYSFALVHLYNSPKIKTQNNNATGVLAEGLYYDIQNKKRLIGDFDVYCRWWDENEKPKDGEAPRALRPTDIPNNGEVRKVAIGLKHVKEDLLYAYGVDSLKKKQWRNKDYLLGTGEVLVALNLRGKWPMENAVFYFKLYADNKELKCEEVSKPGWL